MGLDLVELTIRVEETFEVQIPDRVAAELTTARKSPTSSSRSRGKPRFSFVLIAEGVFVGAA